MKKAMALAYAVLAGIALGVNLLCLSLGYWLLNSWNGKKEEDDECVPS